MVLYQGLARFERDLKPEDIKLGRLEAILDPAWLDLLAAKSTREITDLLNQVIDGKDAKILKRTRRVYDAYALLGGYRKKRANIILALLFALIFRAGNSHHANARPCVELSHLLRFKLPPRVLQLLVQLAWDGAVRPGDEELNPAWIPLDHSRAREVLSRHPDMDARLFVKFPEEAYLEMMLLLGRHDVFLVADALNGFSDDNRVLKQTYLGICSRICPPRALVSLKNSLGEIAYSEEVDRGKAAIWVTWFRGKLYVPEKQTLLEKLVDAVRAGLKHLAAEICQDAKLDTLAIKGDFTDGVMRLLCPALNMRLLIRSKRSCVWSNTFAQYFREQDRMLLEAALQAHNQDTSNFAQMDPEAATTFLEVLLFKNIDLLEQIAQPHHRLALLAHCIKNGIPGPKFIDAELVPGEMLVEAARLCRRWIVWQLASQKKWDVTFDDATVQQILQRSPQTLVLLYEQQVLAPTPTHVLMACQTSGAACVVAGSNLPPQEEWLAACIGSRDCIEKIRLLNATPEQLSRLPDFAGKSKALRRALKHFPKPLVIKTGL